MFETKRLAHLIDLQARSYKLLLWLEGAYVNRKLNFTNFHRSVQGSSAISAWLSEFYNDLPHETKPPDRKSISEFAGILDTYISSSFEVDRDEEWSGCQCSLCVFSLAKIRIKRVKLTREHRFKAKKLNKRALKKLVNIHYPPARDRYLEKLVKLARLKEDIAILAWADRLDNRAEGIGEGPAIVALWRAFAMDETGRTKQGFEMTSEFIFSAQNRLIAFLDADHR